MTLPLALRYRQEARALARGRGLDVAARGERVAEALWGRESSRTGWDVGM